MATQSCEQTVNLSQAIVVIVDGKGSSNKVTGLKSLFLPQLTELLKTSRITYDDDELVMAVTNDPRLSFQFWPAAGGETFIICVTLNHTIIPASL